VDEAHPTPGRRRNMQAIRRRDTRPELALRRALHAAGYRYRCDYRIDVVGGRARPDIAFTRAKVAVFVDGCFWHSCPEHGRTPQANPDYWAPKLERNRDRDRANTRALEAAGWLVLRIWEHTDVSDAVAIVRRILPAAAAHDVPTSMRCPSTE
jgi:DNA mismatch endonuclease (patch repair protein)